MLDEVPEDNCRFLEESGFKIYMAGLVRFYHIEVILFEYNLFSIHFYFQFGVMSHTYVLTAENGVPVFIYWSTGNIPQENHFCSKYFCQGPNDASKPVTNYVSIAPAKEAKNDILYIGGQKVDR